MNLYQKIHAIMEELPHVGKNMKVEYEGKSVSYPALSESHMLEMARPLFMKHKILVIPEELLHLSTAGKVTTISIRYRIQDIDSDEHFSVVSVGQGHDGADKGSGKAFTYCNKYLYVKLLQLAMLDDDPDNRASEEILADEEEVNLICSELTALVTRSQVPMELTNGYLVRIGEIRAEGDLKAAKTAQKKIPELIKTMVAKNASG